MDQRPGELNDLAPRPLPLMQHQQSPKRIGRADTTSSSSD
jgi:hypothetical protein